METSSQKIKRIIADTLAIDKHLITYDTDLKRDLSVDSLDFLEIITIVEEEFGVRVPDDKVERFKKVGDLIKYFEETQSTPRYRNINQAA
jgi:acyl carrier protein